MVWRLEADGERKLLFGYAMLDGFTVDREAGVIAIPLPDTMAEAQILFGVKDEA